MTMGLCLRQQVSTGQRPGKDDEFGSYANEIGYGAGVRGPENDEKTL
jgi:hypothetical protein